MELNEILKKISAWVDTKEFIRGAAVVGSHAKGTAKPDSDIDIVLLTKGSQLEHRNNTSWLDEIDLSELGFNRDRYEDHDYGDNMARHVFYSPFLEIEFGFVPVEWASSSPVRESTRSIVAPAMIIISDKDQHFRTLAEKIGIKKYSQISCKL